jgi:hypothetical protein
MFPSHWYNVSVTMRNTGNTDWSPNGNYVLASFSPEMNMTWGVNRVALSSTVWSTTSTTFNFQVRAPAAPGSYNFYWRMLQEGVGWFGLGAYVSVTVREPVNNAQLMSQSIPDQVRVDQAHEVVVTMRNNGDLPWTRAQQYTLMSQAPHNNMTWGVSRVLLPVDTVNPGESATFRFAVTAPLAANSYSSQWGMQREGYGSFGASTSVVSVNVRDLINNAQPVEQRVVSQMVAGQSFTASVTMVNIGESTWTRDKQYTLMAQSPHNNTTWGFN